MNTKLSYAEKLMSLLTGSPEVKVLIDREKSQAAEAEKQARIECLAQIKNLRLAEIEAKQNLDATVSAVNAAEAKLNELKTKVAIAWNAHTDVQSKRGHSENELSKLHGEWAVSKTLYKLHRLIQQTELEINYLELAKNPHVMVDGRVTFRAVAPEISTNQNLLKQRLVGAKALYEKAKEFVESEMAPNEIKGLCDSICSAIGQPLNPIEIAA